MLRLVRWLAVLHTLLLPAAFAQQQHYLLEETMAAEGRTAQFEAAQKDYCAAVVRGGAPACLIFSPTTFSPHGLYLTLLAFGSFSHYDEGTYTSKGLTAEQAQELSARRTPATAGNVESALALVAPASYLSSVPGSLVRVTDFEIDPAQSSELYSYLRTVELPAAHRSGLLSSELYRVVAGGETNRFLLLQRFDRFAQLDQVEPFGASSSAEDRRGGPHKGFPLLHVRTTVLRIRADLAASQ